MEQLSVCKVPPGMVLEHLQGLQRMQRSSASSCLIDHSAHCEGATMQEFGLIRCSVLSPVQRIFITPQAAAPQLKAMT